MKPVNKKQKTLSAVQKELLKTHSDHYSKLHVKEMKQKMLEGYCFQQAHTLAKKNVKVK